MYYWFGQRILGFGWQAQHIPEYDLANTRSKDQAIGDMPDRQ
jgi:hypothetical protein